MTTILTEISQEQEQQVIALQLNHAKTHTASPPKYISATNTIESASEKVNRSKPDIKDTSSVRHVFLTSILYTLHFFYIVFIAFKSLHAYLYNLYYSSDNDIRQQISNDKSRLTKIPEHITINISRELSSTRSCKDWEDIMYSVSKATCWAWEFGVKEVSVYDASGVMKSMAVDMYKQQSNVLHKWMMHSQGEKTRPAIKFSILSGENGKPHMGYVTQRMAKEVSSSERIDIKLVDEYMHMDNVSDPDLMIVFDGLPHNYVSLDGYPPWHIRLTEIANCSTYHCLNYALFSKCLYRFSKVEQRFGR